MPSFGRERSGDEIMKRVSLGSKKQWLLVGTALTAIVILGMLFLPKVKSEPSKETLKDKEVRPLVNVETIQRQNMLGRVTLIGQTVPDAQVDIVAKYAGRVKQVNGELGQKVSAGQVLVVQDTEDIDLSIAQTYAALRQARADTTETTAGFHANYQKAQEDYKYSVNNYQRYKTLYETGAVSRDSLDLAEQKMNNAKASLDALKNQGNGVPASIESKNAQVIKTEKNIAALEKQKDDLILRAPRSGIIGYRQVEIGALVQPGQKLLSIVDSSKIYIDCRLSEKDAAHLRIGMEADVQVQSLGKSYSGKIIYISPATDPETKTFSVRIALAAPDSLLKAGMFARLEVNVLLSEQALCVPKEAVTEDKGKYYLFIISPQGIVKKQLVQLGLENDEQYEILNGFKEGDQVAISNIGRLRPGMKVNFKQDQQGAQK